LGPILLGSHSRKKEEENMGTEVKNKEGILGTEENNDGSAVQEVVKDGEKVAEIRNKEGILGTEENEDGSPVKVVVPT
jgi:hypothetical protein